ncbi:MAG: universal stress protein [Coxiellaceae bacterium]|nr:universal stress protein [Coxiellaceae bacterium]
MATTKKVVKHILLATDLSDNSNMLFKRATAIAKAAHAKISVIHVFAHTPIAYAGEFSIPIDVEFEMTLKREAHKHLQKLGKKYNIPAKMLHLCEGSIKATVTDFAKKIKADLIVVGTHSHHGLDILLGSQANAILHAASCDVWVVRIKK